MAKAATPPIAARVLTPAEYPLSIRIRHGRPNDVRFAAIHPLGLFHVEHHGANHMQAYFTPKRKGSKAQMIGAGNGLAGALRRVKNHEDELLNPDAPREEGKNGPVSIHALGRRTGGPKPPTQLDREIDEFLRLHGDA